MEINPTCLLAVCLEATAPSRARKSPACNVIMHGTDNRQSRCFLGRSKVSGLVGATQWLDEGSLQRRSIHRTPAVIQCWPLRIPTIQSSSRRAFFSFLS